MKQFKRSLILIGMPGAGKSYWARRLAGEWGGVALDLDRELTRISGKSIPQIFAQEGEAGFRKTEAEVLQKVLMEGKWDFLATGGGTPCHADNLDRLKAAGTVVYLEAPVSVLAARLVAEKEARPLLAGLESAELLQKLAQLLALRKPYYRQAHYVVSVEGLSEATFAPL